MADVLRASVQWETPPERFIDVIMQNKQSENSKASKDKRTAAEIKASVLSKVNEGRAATN